MLLNDLVLLFCLILNMHTLLKFQLDNYYNTLFTSGGMEKHAFKFMFGKNFYKRSNSSVLTPFSFIFNLVSMMYAFGSIVYFHSENTTWYQLETAYI